VRQAECHDKLEKLLVHFFTHFFLPFFFYLHGGTARHVCAVCARVSIVTFVCDFFWGGGNMFGGMCVVPFMDARVR
jgi:hypothetical protein